MIYSFGSNGNGQLSLSHLEDVHIPTPCVVPSSFPITPPHTIAAGGNHTVLLFPSGAAYISGDNTSRQCCQPLAIPRFTSFHPVSPPHWKLASAGWNFTILVGGDEKVYVSGHGGKGELGLGQGVDTAQMQVIPKFPPAGTAVVQLASGMAHSVAVLSDGQVYGWGAGRKGQLGSPHAAITDRPRKIEVPWEVEQAVCGREFSVFLSRAHTATAGRKVLFLGNDKFNIQNSLGTELVGAVSIQASWGGVYILYKDGLVQGFGRNDRGQLPPTNLKVESFAVGSEHGVAIVEGKLIAWGWGEHGNCGRSRDMPGGGDVVGRTEVVGVGNGRIKGVGAGCATSWVWIEDKKDGEGVDKVDRK